MSRLGKSCAVGCIFFGISGARAERFISFSANNNGPVTTGTFHIGTSQLGSSSVQELLTLTLESGDTTVTMRDRAIPAEGIPGVCRRASVGGRNGIQVFHPDSVQFWGSAEGNGWQLINHGTDGSLTLTLQAPGQPWTLQVGEFGSNPQLGSAAAPAVGIVGLSVILAIALIGGAFLFRREIRAAS